MPELNDQQMKKLAQCIVSAIHEPQLQMELIDHCACAVEYLMSEGQSFDEALDHALYKLEPAGLHAIEVAVQQVLIPQTLQTMKTILFLSGFVAAFCIMLGMLFKVQHWPGADNLLMIGDLGLITAMFALIITSVFTRRAISSATLIRLVAGSAGGLMIGVGSFFKIMHWPGASIQLILGMGLFAFLFIPIFFWQLYKREMKAV